MTPLYNVKLEFTLIFASAYAFGFRIGATIGLLIGLIWGIVSPLGFGGPIIPFLMGANVIYAFAGWGASKIWGYKQLKPYSELNVFFGSILAVCAFLWDTVTNFGTAFLLFFAKITWAKFLGVEAAGILFMVTHELADFEMGAALAPIIIVYFLRVFGEPGKASLVVKNEEAMPSPQSTIPRAEN